ncbi:hypothetical protein CKA32_001537 [Geitlerinema sp. FC II]|nr:hypothetical protein CKA32_001537 [Geitlerinema sp. FC II]
MSQTVILRQSAEVFSMSERLNFSDIERNATPQSIERGREYYEWGQVQSISRRGSLLQACVMGESQSYYDTFLDVESCSAECSCPYDWGGWCKHIVAVALTYLHDAEQIEERFSLGDLLGALEEFQEVALIEHLVDLHPFLIEDIEAYVRDNASLEERIPPLPPPPPVVDVKPFRQRLDRTITRGIDRFESGECDYDNPVEEEVFDLFDPVRLYLDRGSGHDAIAILEAVTEVYLDRWDDLDNYGLDLLEFREELDRLWAEALLSTDLDAPQKVDLEVVIEADDDRCPDWFPLRRLAFDRGWDDETLQQVLTGQSPTEFTEPLELVEIRLKLLERQERFEEYLNLSRFTEQIDLYLEMLIQCERIEDAIAQLDSIKTKEEAYRISKRFAEKDRLDVALNLAVKGLDLDTRSALLYGSNAINYTAKKTQYDLAMWTSEIAERLQNFDLVLSAKFEAFKAIATYEDYLKIQEIAGETWDVLKEDLLQSLKKYSGWNALSARVQIYLYEQMFDEAIALVNDLYYPDRDLIRQVMDAVLSDRAEWVLNNARDRAEDILDRALAKAYHHAIDWLKYVKHAYEQLDNSQGWLSYRNRLTQEHGRKYKFMGLLNEAGF